MWHDAQSQFAAALTDSSAPPPTDVHAPAGRFDVHRNNMMVGLRSALEETFPVVKSLVGDEFFVVMAQSFVSKHLPETPVLAEYGAAMPAFIETFIPARSVPYLADVARLEWFYMESYYAADAPPAAIDILSMRSDAALDATRFNMHPSLRVLSSSWPVAEIWQAHQTTEIVNLSGLAPQPGFTLIVRPAFEVVVISTSQSFFKLVAALLAGKSLATALDTAGDLDDPTAALIDLFEMGLVAGLRNKIENGN
ncbi:MAG: DNA-binding domain-containing protein [Rhodospirillales bacterium]